MSLLRARPKHAKPSRLKQSATPLALTGGLTVAFVAADLSATTSSASAHPAPSASASDFARLAACESGGNYSINTGNGYYGAYQFDLSTWRSVGFSGRPDLASRSTQDEAARRLQAARGWSPWPACSRKLGLGSSTATAPSSSSPARASRSAARTSTAVAPAFPADLVVRSERGTYRPEVRAWQARMAERGWTIGVDGFYGPQSTAVAAAFAAEKGLSTTRRGDLNRSVFTGAWTLRVT